MSAMISLLNVEKYPKCSWDMNKVLADQFYNEILSGNRTTFVYSIDNEYVAEISLVYDMKDIDYTIVMNWG